MHRIVGYHRQQKIDMCCLPLSRCGCYANIGFRGALMPSYLHVPLEMRFRTQPMSMLRYTQLTLLFLPPSLSFALTRFLCLPACPSWIIEKLQTSMASGKLPSLMCTRHWLVLPLSFYSTSFILFFPSSISLSHNLFSLHYCQKFYGHLHNVLQYDTS